MPFENNGKIVTITTESVSTATSSAIGLEREVADERRVPVPRSSESGSLAWSDSIEEFAALPVPTS